MVVLCLGIVVKHPSVTCWSKGYFNKHSRTCCLAPRSLNLDKISFILQNSLVAAMYKKGKTNVLDTIFPSYVESSLSFSSCGNNIALG